LQTRLLLEDRLIEEEEVKFSVSMNQQRFARGDEAFVTEYTDQNQILFLRDKVSIVGENKLQIEPETEQSILLREDITSLLTDLMNGEGQLIANVYDSTVKQLEQFSTKQILQKLNTIQLVFELAKGLRNENSLDYEIYSEIQDKLLLLMTTVQNNDYKKMSRLNELEEILHTLASSGKIIKEAGGRAVDIEFTGKKYGGIRIFKIRKN